ncbi:MAG: ammonium transporter [Alphaproteobacteria bacterium]|jgi:Amt family ammonium transporter|nr:ammonium transporter [Alphaproteobacteria bacterium]MDP6516066.1 ammonium transporter [Alphaproteobacteria bacterium]
MTRAKILLGFPIAALTCLVASAASAQETAALNGANTAWILTATALVLFMTMPGLALFYGGLVRAQNVLSVLMHCFTICCLVSVLWLVFVYSLAFGDGGAANAWIGGFGKAFLAGVGLDTMSGDIPESVFFMFQMTFAIITPALIVGAYVERIKFAAVLLFSALWVILVYAPVAHWVWGGGWLADMGIQDFAGGLVVHMTCGVSALVIAWLLGTRTGFPHDIKRPHSPGLVMTGAAMLWVGWYGFNAGSALAADGNAGMAMTATHISAATAALTWMFVEWIKYGKPTLVGIATGAIAGLATITPASGFVGPSGALIIGFVAGVLCFYGVNLVKGVLKIDDSLDVLAVHGVGGATGTLLTAILGAASLGGLGHSEETIGGQFVIQLIGVVATLVWSAVLTFVIVKVVGGLVGLRVDAQEEIEGVDIISHGERGYEF